MGGARLAIDAGTAVVVLDHEDLQGLIEELVDLVEAAKIVRDTPPARSRGGPPSFPPKGTGTGLEFP